MSRARNLGQTSEAVRGSQKINTTGTKPMTMLKKMPVARAGFGEVKTAAGL
jgi:hypothetical protein